LRGGNGDAHQARGPLQRGRVPVGYVRFPPPPCGPPNSLSPCSPARRAWLGICTSTQRRRGDCKTRTEEKTASSTQIARREELGNSFCGRNKKKVKIIREGTTAQCRRQRWWSVGAWRQPAAELGNATPFRISSTLKLVCSPHDPSFSTFFCVLVTSTARISYIASFCLSFLLPD
jgi:hypothetical protein